MENFVSFSPIEMKDFRILLANVLGVESRY